MKSGEVRPDLVLMHVLYVLFTSHPQDGLVVNFYIPPSRRTPLQAEEALGPISIRSINEKNRQYNEKKEQKYKQ